MPGRAKTTINAKELEVFDRLIDELKQKGHIIADNSQVKVTFWAPYQSKPSTDVKLVLDRLSRHIDINGDKSVSKVELCKILGASKPTLDNWIKKGWVTIPANGRYDWFHSGRKFKINLSDIKNQLSNMTLLLPSNLG